MAQYNQAKQVSEQREQLLSSVAEQLKQPLLFMRQEAELAQISGSTLRPEMIQFSADAGLLLVEHFLTWQRYALQNTSQYAVQVGLTAVMHDVSESLRSIASLHQTNIRFEIAGKYAPVITDTKLLSSGLSALGLAFIEASQPQEQKESRVVFGVHRTRWGVVAGVYSPDINIRADSFARYSKLTGKARQLIPTSSHASMSGVAVADALLSQLALRLRTSRHKNMDGLAVTLAPSAQLSLL